METRSTILKILAVFLSISFSILTANAQPDMDPVNDLPNGYQFSVGWLRLPVGREWGSTGTIDIDADGESVWVAERCASDSLNRNYPIRSCAGSDLPPVLKFSAEGELLTSFGAGMIVMPHGMHVDRDGNIWVTDAPFTVPPGSEGKGHAVYKFSPEGELLLTLGEPGIPGADNAHFNMPTDVVTAENGDIFVSDGHGGETNARIMKFSADGTYITQWGEKGTEPGQFDTPHGMAMDSQGRIFVADRNNNRLQLFDQNGNFLEEWYQFSRLSGIYIDQNDVLYAVDSESNIQRGRGEWKRGIRIGSARTGEVWTLIPDPADPNDGPFFVSSGGEGVAADAEGNIYGAEVGPRGVKRYFRIEDF